MDLLPALLGALVGLLGGLLAPRLIAWCPEPEHDPDENPEDFPDHVPFAELAARPGLAPRCAAAGAVAGALVGAFIGWGWALPWLLFLVPICIALSVVDYATWYLPSRLILPSYGVVVALEALAAIVLQDPAVLLWGVIGGAILGLYYGLVWFISPRTMAFGDVRFGALLGLALGPLGPGTVVVSIATAALLAVLALVPLRRGGNMIRRKVPYGPFLAAGALMAVVLGRVLNTL